MRTIKNVSSVVFLLLAIVFQILCISAYANDAYSSEEVLIRKKLRENGKKLQENSKEIKSLLNELQENLKKIEKECGTPVKNKAKEEYCRKSKVYETWNYYIKLFDALKKQEKTLMQRYNLLKDYRSSGVTDHQQEFKAFLRESKDTGRKIVAVYTSMKDFLPEREAKLLEKKIRNLKKYLKRQKR